MRLALHPTTDTGHRAGRLLLAEADLQALGIYGHRGADTEDRRSTAITDLAGFTVLISDDNVAPLDLAAIAVADGLSCVLAADASPDVSPGERFAERGLSLLVDASPGGLAAALRHHEALTAEPGQPVLLAWTVAGKPLRHGEAIPFPDPLGARWGRHLPPRPGQEPSLIQVEVPVEGPWGGALARVTRRAGRRPVHALVAVADDRRHLAALALAAGALLVARGAAAPGFSRPEHAAAAYLREATRVGLEVAGFEARG
jgi:hypothetical protein